ncbi:MAG TPA: zf-HC2 domain-containing protein [Gemmatimonadales bacterium]|nr:zf-HC2 domain-containing protein [Gemmatimonadales bacterium]
MRQELPHDEMLELLPAAALEILDGAELRRLQAHLPGCPGCAELLSQYRDAAAGLALQVPVDAMNPGRSAAVRDRLLTRVRAGRTTKTARGLRVDGWLGWMVAAGMAGILLVHHSVHQTVDYGWLLSGVLVFVLMGLLVYVRKQQRRAAELQQRLEATFRRSPTS